MLQDFADDEGAVGVYAGGEGCFVALAGPDALDGIDDAPAALLELIERGLDCCAGRVWPRAAATTAPINGAKFWRI